MTDELDLLRSFRSDLDGADADAWGRVRTAVAERTGVILSERPDEPLDDGGAAVTTMSSHEPDATYVSLGDDRGEASSRTGHRRHAIAGAAAALLLLVGATAWLATSEEAPDRGVADVVPGDTSPPDSTPLDTTSTARAPFAPTWLPEGFGLTGVVRPEASEVDAVGAETWSIYTPGGAVGPDAPEALMVAAFGPVVGDLRLSDRDDGRGRLIDVGSGEALLHESGDIVSLELELDGQVLRVLGRGLDTDAVIAAAASASVAGGGGGSLSALPDGWALHSTRPVAPVGASLAYMVADPALVGDSSVNPSIVVSWAPGGLEALEAARLFIDESVVGCGDDGCGLGVDGPTVVGRSVFAVDEPANTDLELIWLRDEMVVTVTATGDVALGELISMVRSFRETTWEDLEAQLPPG